MPAIAAIYAEHVLGGTGSFEEVPPDVEVMGERFRAVVDAGYPWFVADAPARDGGAADTVPVSGADSGSLAIAGYAYAAPWKARSAYRFTVEDSIYVAAAHTGRGVGSRLLGHLIEDCAGRGYRAMMAVAGDGENTGSVALHRRHGFRVVGTARGIGLKFGRWLDVVYLQRSLP